MLRERPPAAEGGLEKEDVERLSKAYAAKILGCDAHDAPAWVRAAAAADDPGAAAACCASALPASEGSLEKEDIERLSKAYADKIACDEPYPYAARGVEQDRAPYTYADEDAAEARAVQDTAHGRVRRRRRERAPAGEGVRARGRRRRRGSGARALSPAFSEHRTRAPRACSC